MVTYDARSAVTFACKAHWLKLEGGANVNATTSQAGANLPDAATFHDNRVEIEPL